VNGQRPPPGGRCLIATTIEVFGIGVGPLVTQPGWEFGYLFGLIKNRGHTTLTIDSVSLRGPRVGTVITVPDLRIAVGAGLPTEQSNYVTDPRSPALALEAARSRYRLRPGAGVRRRPQ
jgi:hypothetical protein